MMAGKCGDGDRETSWRFCLLADRCSVRRARVAIRQIATECTNIV
jgi:hypothetical protein